MNKIFDLIITLYNSGKTDFKKRLNNLICVVESVPSNVNLILVEQTMSDRETFISNISDEFSHTKINKVFLEYDGPFNKSWLYNVGVKHHSVTNNILLGESDIIFDPLYFSKLYKYVNSYKTSKNNWCIGWDKVVYLNEEKTDVEDNPKFNHMNNCVPDIYYCCGMVVHFNKNFYWSIGGANESIKGAAGVDNCIACRAKFASNDIMLKFPYTIHHYYHDRNYDVNDWNLEENKKYLKKILKNPKKMITELLKNIDNLGLTDKPCDNINRDI